MPFPALRRPLFALLALGVVAGACGSEAVVTTTTLADTTTAAVTTTTVARSTTSTTAGPGDRPYGGEVIVGAVEAPVTLNWYAPGGESAIVTTLGQAYWAGVADVDGFSLELVPDVVVELPTVANGGLAVNGDGTETVSLTIDPRAVWADGTPISGEDFRFTYETIMTPGNAVDRSGYEDIIPESVVVGDKSFAFTLRRPSLVVESLFGVLLPAHVVAGSDLMADWNDRMWVSAGPFQFDSWVPASTDVPFETIVLTRNEAYWKTDPVTGQSLPYLDRVVYRFVGDPDVLVAEFEERQFDVITLGVVDAAVLDGLGALPGAVVETVGDGQWEHLAFQFGEGRLVRNPDSYNQHIEYRRAVAHAIDRDALIDAVFAGWGEPMLSHLEAFTPAWAGEGWALYPYDPEAAREQLELLCAKEGVDCDAAPPRMVLTTTSTDLRIRLAEALEPMLLEVGIAFEEVLEPPLVFFGPTLDYGRFDVAEWSWKGEPGLVGPVAAHGAWDPGEVPPTGLAFSRWGSRGVSGQPEAGYNQGPSSVIDDASRRFEIIAAQMRFTADESELRALFTEAESILAAQVVFIPLFQTPDAAAYWGDEVGGFRHNAVTGDLWNVGEWHRVDG